MDHILCTQKSFERATPYCFNIHLNFLPVSNIMNIEKLCRVLFFTCIIECHKKQKKSFKRRRHCCRCRRLRRHHHHPRTITHCTYSIHKVKSHISPLLKVFTLLRIFALWALFCAFSCFACIFFVLFCLWHCCRLFIPLVLCYCVYVLHIIFFVLFLHFSTNIDFLKSIQSICFVRV